MQVLEAAVADQVDLDASRSSTQGTGDARAGLRRVRRRQDRARPRTTATPGSSAATHELHGRGLGRLPRQAASRCRPSSAASRWPAAPTRRAIWHDVHATQARSTLRAQHAQGRTSDERRPSARRPHRRAGARRADRASPRPTAPAPGARTTTAPTGDGGTGAGARRSRRPTPAAADAAAPAGRRRRRDGERRPREQPAPGDGRRRRRAPARGSAPSSPAATAARRGGCRARRSATAARPPS